MLRLGRPLAVQGRLSMAHVFVSYLSSDYEKVEQLCRALEKRGVETWLDRDELQPGQRWKEEIKEAIKQGAFFLACFSSAYQSQQSTYMNEELLLAIEELRLRPTDRAWFIPVLLDSCEVPDRAIGGGESLRDLQWVDLSQNWATGVERLVKVLRTDAQAASLQGTSLNGVRSAVEALNYQQQAIREYAGYPSYEFRQAQLKRVEDEKARPVEAERAELKPPPEKVARLKFRTHITYGEPADSLPKGYLHVVKLPKGQGEIAVRSEDIIIGRYLQPLGPDSCKVELKGTAFTVSNGLGITFAPNSRVAVAKAGAKGLLLVGLANVSR